MRSVMALARWVAAATLWAALGLALDGPRSLAESGSAGIGWLGQVTSPLASSGGAPQPASSLRASRVPAAVRTLNRKVSPKHKLASEPASGGSAKVSALCFDERRRLVRLK